MKKATMVVSIVEGILNLVGAAFFVFYAFLLLVLKGVGDGIGSAGGNETGANPALAYIGWTSFVVAGLLAIGSVFAFIIAGFAHKEPLKRKGLKTLGILCLITLTWPTGILSLILAKKGN